MRIVGNHHVGGRHRPHRAAVAAVHKMAKYMKLSQLPTAPASFDYSTLNPAPLADILANDTLGDCTAAGAGHLIDVFTGGGGSPVAITAAQTIAFYSQSTGYVPGDPSTDQGGDEVTVLTSWQQKGFDGNGAHPIKGFVLVDGTNAAELASACWLFGGLYFGLELTDAMANTQSGGFEWGPGTPNPNDGHCVVGLGGLSAGIKIDTWGLLGLLEFTAIAELCVDSAGGTVFAVISQEWVNATKNLAPSGFDWEQLASDFDLALGGNVPMPAPPSPTPPNPPAPTPAPPTSNPPLATVLAAFDAAVDASAPLEDKNQIKALAASTLTPMWPAQS